MINACISYVISECCRIDGFGGGGGRYLSLSEMLILPEIGITFSFVTYTDYNFRLFRVAGGVGAGGDYLLLFSFSGITRFRAIALPA